MAGPIQTSLNKLIGLVSGGIAASKKLSEDEGQIRTAEEQEAVAKATKVAEKKAKSGEEREKEALTSAYRTAQKKGLAKIQNLIFDESGEAVATYNEMASLLSRQALSNHLESRKATKRNIEERRSYLQQRKGGKR